MEDVPLPRDRAEELNHLMERIDNTLTDLSGNIRAQRFSHLVVPFHGETAEFKVWVQSLEQYRNLTGGTDADLRRYTYEMSRGVARDVIHRYLGAHPNCTWDALKAMLTQRFGPVTCPDYAFGLLRELEQGPTETARALSDRLISLAEEAYRGETNHALVEGQLVGYFVDALRGDFIKMRILRENPPTLARAVDIAVAEEELGLRFAHRQRRFTGHAQRETARPRPETARPRPSQTEERMEVDHARSQARCYHCDLPGHRMRECPRRQAERKRQARVPSRRPLN